MALPPAPLVVRTALVHKLHNQDVINVVNWAYDDEPVPSQIEQLAATVAAQWDTNIMAFPSYQLTFRQVEARQAVPGSGYAYDFPVAQPAEGESSAPAPNNQTACVLSLRTGRAGRSYRGRCFIGGIPSNAVVDGLIVDAFRTNLAVAFKAFIDAVSEARGVTPVVLSYFNAGIQRPAAVWTPITSVLSVTAYPAGQERRRPGIGS